jgi:predicted DNA-binding ribbon-helix-helix protein
MKSLVVKRSVVLAGHKTSITLEEPFWKGLKEIAWRRSQSLCEVISSIDAERTFGNLSSAVRLFVLSHYQGEVGRPSTSSALIEPVTFAERSV